MVYEIPINEKDIMNEVYDRNLKSLRVSGSAGDVTVDAGSILNTYEFHDLDKFDSTTSYIGYQDGEGQWLIKKMVKSPDGDIDMTYANISNNATKLTYSDAWTDRTTLTYEDIKNLTFIATGVTKENYIVSQLITIPAGNSIYLMGKTNGKQSTFTDFSVDADDVDVVLELFEGAVYSVIGTTVTPVNLDRTSIETAAMEVYSNPTITTPGTLLETREILGDKKLGGGIGFLVPWKLKSATNYIYKVTNNAVTDTKLSFIFNFYEE